MKFPTLTFAVLATAWSAAPLAADVAYVIDKLLVGVHQEKDLNSAIVKVLPTGTRLDVLQRDGELAEVKDADGTTGWVDTAYLMAEEPAELRVKELTNEIAGLKKKLSAGPSAAEPASDRDELTKENTELKGKLSTEKLKVGELQTKVSALEAQIAARPTTPADTVIADLEQKNQSLARELEAATQANNQLEAELRQNGGPLVPIAVDTLSTPVIVGVVAALVLAFGGGIYCMDYLNRRRHGGFRV